jgi:hypothetical protein
MTFARFLPIPHPLQMVSGIILMNLYVSYFLIVSRAVESVHTTSISDSTIFKTPTPTPTLTPS